MSPTRLNPALPLELEGMVLKALEKDREVRYQTAADVRADVTRIRRQSDLGSARLRLPFDNLSPDPDDAFLADGLTEEVIADLTKVPLRVISRTSAMTLGGRPPAFPVALWK